MDMLTQFCEPFDMSDFENLKPQRTPLVVGLNYFGLIVFIPAGLAFLAKGSRLSEDNMFFVLLNVGLGSLLIVSSFVLLRLSSNTRVQSRYVDGTEKKKTSFSLPKAPMTPMRISRWFLIPILTFWFTIGLLLLALGYYGFKLGHFMEATFISLTGGLLVVGFYSALPDRRSESAFEKEALDTKDQEVIFDNCSLKVARRLVDSIWGYAPQGHYFHFPWSDIHSFEVHPARASDPQNSSDAFYAIKIQGHFLAVQINREPFNGREKKFLEILQRYCPVPIDIYDDLR